MKRLSKNTYIDEEDGIKYFYIERKDGTTSKTEVGKPRFYSDDDACSFVKKLSDDNEFEAIAMFSDTITSLKNLEASQKREDSYRFPIDFEDYDEETLLRIEDKRDKLAEAYALVEENKRDALEYVKEMNYDKYHRMFLKGVNNGMTSTELTSEFNRMFSGSFDDEDIKLMIKIYNEKK